MFTRGGASGNQNEKRQLQRSSGDELDDFLEEQLQRRPEVRIINRYAVVMAYIRLGLKGIGALALLWATVVLLGGFVSSLEGDDFCYVTVIAFIQAAGVFDAMGDARFVFLANWIENLKRRTHSVLDLTLIVVFTPVVYSAVLGPSVCILLPLFGITNSELCLGYAEPNLKQALKLFYYLSIVHGAICLLCIVIETTADEGLVEKFGRRHGLSPEVLDGYLHQTKQTCAKNLESIESWNLIVYGAGLLDSQLPEDYASGGRVLNILIDQDTPALITRLLIRSPRQRIQKLIETLTWSNPAEREMRWLAARIVEHLAGHLNLAHFPGALECISSLFETSCHNNGDQEALHLPFVVGRSKHKRRINNMLHDMVNGVLQGRNTLLLILSGQFYVVAICLYLRAIYYYFSPPENVGTPELDNKQRGSDEDLLLPGLRILENLAHNRHNCTMIYNTQDLLCQIVAPVRSNELIHDIKSSAAWTKVVDGSLKVVSRLMSSSGSAGNKMRRLITCDTNAVKNLKAVVAMDMKSNNGIIQLKIRAIEVLTQLALHHPASTSATVIREHLHIFLQDDWMGNYLKGEKMRFEHQSTNQQNNLPEPSTGALMDNLILIVSNVCPLILFVGGTQERVTRAREARELRAAEACLTVMRAGQAHLMKEAQESASQFKEKAGEALAMLSSDSEPQRLSRASRLKYVQKTMPVVLLTCLTPVSRPSNVK
ncbi:uncharacterized protein LOC119366357 isoform X1 [Triticum dicoccoides]|uniref:uncharacterized protein LOC119366357 isoform X1 n=1 Tax=Triticum dicoccoides TaxID=85692 RepID=UPI0018900B25|nr:uncharacterized protein LOC119366357 isoform X1 [Triticum dicoccoides]